MKKTLSFLLIAVLLVSSVLGVSAAVTRKTVISTPDSVTLETEVASETITQETAQETAQVQLTSEDELIIPTITGTWKHEKFPSNCSIDVNMQCGNTLDMTITVANDRLTKIAYSHVEVTLDNVYDDGVVIRGEGSFEYTDSFGNEGTGIVSASENVILLIINEEYNAGRGWGISRATGDYIFYGDGTVTPGPGPDMPELRTVWHNVSSPIDSSIVINSQDGNTINFTVTAMKENASQIATSDITVTLDTRYDGTLVRGDADFTYVDSFGHEGTGSIAVSENVIILVIEQESENDGTWSIAHTTGKYIY